MSRFSLLLHSLTVLSPGAAPLWAQAVSPNEKGEVVIGFSGVARFGALLNGLEIIPQ